MMDNIVYGFYICLTIAVVLRCIMVVFLPNNKLSKKIYKYKLDVLKKRFDIREVHNEKAYEKRVKEHSIVLIFILPIACFIIVGFNSEFAILSMILVCIIYKYFETTEKNILKNDKGILL
jgi:hypothetical protein